MKVGSVGPLYFFSGVDPRYTEAVLFLSQRGYEKQDISGGSAISVIFFIMVLIVALTQRYVTKERD